MRRPLQAWCLSVTLAFGSLVCLPAPQARAEAPKEANLFLWQVVGPSDSAASPDYLVGTIHLALPADQTLPKAALTCLRQSTSFVMEADIEAIRPETLVPYLFRQDGKSNKAFLSDKAWQRTVSQAKGLGLPEDQVTRMEPWFLTTFLGIGPNDPNRTRDMLLRRAAEGLRVPVSYLEKADEQLHMMQTLPAPYFYEQIELLDDSIVHNQHLSDAYDTGDLKAVEAETFDPAEIGKYPVVYQHLFYERNDRWMPVVERLFRTHRAFVAVGLGHLIGDHGLIHLLQAKGYTVTRLAAPATSKVAASSRQAPGCAVWWRVATGSV